MNSDDDYNDDEQMLVQCVNNQNSNDNDDWDDYDDDNNNSNNRQRQTRNDYKKTRKEKNIDQFYDKIRGYREQGEKLQLLLKKISYSDQDEIFERLEDIDLIKAIEYVPLEFDLLKNIICLLKMAAEAEDERIVEIILESDQFKNLIYQMCITIYDQNNQIYFKEIVYLFKDLLSIFKKCDNIIDLRFSPIIFLIELIELVDQDYPDCELALLFDDYQLLKDILKEYDYSNDYVECPVQPLMLEFDFKQQIMGKLQTQKYLNYHFFILREDYLRDFREFIYKFKTNTIKMNDKQFPMYQEVKLIDFDISNKDIIWIIKLKQYNMDGRRRKVLDWTKSKRLTHGTLLAFTNMEGYPIVFGVITERDVYQRDYKKYFEIELSIKLISKDIQQFLDLFKCTNIVIENPIIFDVSTSYLQSLKSTKLPFKDIIIHGSRRVEIPSYISNYNYKIYHQNSNDDYNNDNYDLCQYQIMSLQDQQWNSSGSLDQSQMNALKLMLSTEIALIQGPPGTGKTYCGALAVRNLLENVSNQSLPILVVCYTNHALDQFLNHILNFVDHSDVLRLGFGCKDPNIIQCKIRQEKTKIDFEWDKFYELKSYIRSLMEKILDSSYTVYREDIKTHWPDLYESIRYDECVKDIRDLDKLFGYWLECKIPPEINQWENFYSENRQFNQVTQINRYQSIQQIDQVEINEEIDREDDDEETDIVADEDGDEYLDTDEEEEARYFREEYASQNNHHSDRYYMKSIVNKRIPYDYQGIADLKKDMNFNPWTLNELDIQGIQDYISHLMLLQDIQKYTSLVKQFEKMSQIQKSQYQKADLYQFDSKKIIGVTISGAAKHIEILKKLDTKILVIEEAAEVLESHLISILTPNIQHLILIGDHQQLKPKLSCYKLEQDYGANKSLFQKLFEQGIKNVTLTCQRRMKPKFADFIRLIYGNTYQDNIPQEQINTTIDGMNSDLVYFNHSWLEERDANSTSTQNRKEANMIIELVFYLVGCQHKQETISVITLYLKQALSIKKILLERGLKNVKVQTVDNYQGEENEIVIVSLVRSNNQGQIGFVKMENRINVALSRARVGLYVFGNFKCIQQKSPPFHIWSRIIALAEQKNVMKNHLQLCCLRHKKQRSAKTPEQMTLFKPGCCDEICRASFPDCSHRCALICHLGIHKKEDCYFKCERYLACSHRCTAECGFQCSLVECKVKVKKTLPCSHKAVVECYQPENLVFCEELISKSFPCGHTLTFQCGDKDRHNYCQAKCDKKLPCRHKNFCTNVCSEKCSPCNMGVKKNLPCGHTKEFYCSQVTDMSYLKLECKQPCIKVLACGHPNDCKQLCHQTCDPCSFIVPKILSLCGHEYPFKCSQFINGNLNRQIKVQCEQPVNKLLPCGHNLRMMCYEAANTVICEQNCIKVRRCEHVVQSPCVHPCHEPCPPCNEMVPKQLQCGHQVNIQCCKFNLPQRHCMLACKKQLICGHPNQCTKPCSKPCDPCLEMAQKILPCGHVIDVQCYRKTQYLKCPRPCPKTICTICNKPYTCNKLCGEPCQVCQNVIVKQLPCGHSQQTTCGEAWTICREIIQKYKDCGEHFENVPCSQRHSRKSNCKEHCVIF